MIESTTEVYAGQIGLRSYLSTHYLRGASHLAELAKEYEIRKDIPKKFDPNHRAYVTSAIMLVANFLEAAVNEVYVDAADGHPSYIGHLASEHIAALKCYWESTEGDNLHVNVLKKYQKALKLAGRPAFATGRAPYQEVATFVSLRNALIHFKPKTYSVPDQDTLLKGMRAHIGTKKKGVVKYPLNPFALGDEGTMALDRILGYGTAAWSLDNARAFAGEFFKRLGITPNYHRFKDEI